MTPAMHLTRFGRYEIIRKLGRSMTDVYLALDPETNQRVVLKLVEHSKDSYTHLVVEAERRGAQIQQQLHAKDSRILEVYDFGDQNGCFFVAMQYAEGHSLAEVILKERRLDPMRVARIASEICGQLETLHSFEADIEGQKRAVVHGDIKPSNIQIGPNGEVWLLDFGIAKVITATRNLTQHNLGSPAYCSPQRLKSGSVDPFSDLWAVGVCMYEMVSGLPPYQAQTTRKLEDLIQSRRPPRDLPQDCPVGLRAIIRKTIAAEPKRRYASAQALGEDLKLFLDGKRPVAENEHEASWDANATVEKPRPTAARNLPKFDVEKTLSEMNVLMWCLIAGLVIGLCCFLPATQFFRFRSATTALRGARDYSRLPIQEAQRDVRTGEEWTRRYAWLGSLSPAASLHSSTRSRLAAAGNAVLDRFRNSSEPGFDGYDWDRARDCFALLEDMEPSSPEWKAKLHTTEGFRQIVRSPQGAEKEFREALQAEPRLVEAHLGLAYLYVYATRNIGMAMAEFRAAENAGYRPGPREQVQQADAFLYRAEQEYKDWQHATASSAKRRLASLMKRDLERARELYEPITGYSTVSANLERLERDDVRYAATQYVKPVKVVKKSRSRRWR